MQHSAADIWNQLELAAITLRRVPAPSGSGPRGYGGSWPDVVRSTFEAYGYSPATLRVVPSAQEIKLMDEAIDWLSLLPDPVDRRIVWMRADNHRWRAICHSSGLVRSTCVRRLKASLLTIEKKLNHSAKISKRTANRVGGARGTGGV